ncbi:MAG: DEAD/DEAH box helicase [Pirellulales bacterium]|nr:DEAD/DEAH box helicase [Pirellulales bacterium]
MFSATMPKEIRELAAQWLTDPVHVQVAPDAEPAEKIEQSVYFVEPRQKSRLLANFLQNMPSTRTLVFSRTKHGADKIVRNLNREGIQAAAIHGNKSQAARQRVLAQFKSDRLLVLIATDIAARGLDVDDISHVINYDMPHDAETYVHRIGRTGRAGAEGIAVSFCGRDERPCLRSVERLIRNTLTIEQHEYSQGTEQSESQSPAVPHGQKPIRRKSRQGRPKSKGSFQRGGRKAGKPKAPRANTGKPQAGRPKSGKAKISRRKAGKSKLKATT